ncbi:hypothetical protein Tco_1316665 [Tanacetum coccineum]
MAHLVANITLNSARSCVIQSAFLTQGTVSSISIIFIWGGSISPEGFLSSVLLWLVIIIAVVGVGVTVVVVIIVASDYDEYDTPSHTKKVFANMRRQGKDFLGIVTPLFPSILASQAVEGKGPGQPTEPQHIPTTASPSHSSEPTNLDADEAVQEERGDNVERAATTATSLDAKQCSGGSPMCQEAMRDTIAQTRYERVSTPSYDSPLLGVNTPGSDEERIELKELMNMCTKLSDKGSAPIATVGVSVSTAKPSTPPTTTTTFIKDEDHNCSDLYENEKSKIKIKIKGKRNKGKGIMQKPEKPVKVKGKDQIEYDADMAKRLKAELDEEVRLEREREEEASNTTLIEEWDTIEARIDADA